MSTSPRIRLILDCIKILLLIVVLGLLFMGEWYNGDLTHVSGFHPLLHFHDAMVSIIGLVVLWGFIYLIEQVWLYE